MPEENMALSMDRVMSKLEEIVREEFGKEMAVALFVVPFYDPDKPGEIGDGQYISNATRAFVHDVLAGLVAKWDADARASALKDQT